MHSNKKLDLASLANDFIIEKSSFKTKCLVLVLVSLICTNSTIILQVNATTGLKADGWTEVTKDWPLDKTNYFIAHEKGHHFVEIKLPPKLNNDLIVTLNYYLSYKRVKPVVNMIQCDLNTFLIDESTGVDDLNGQWREHKVKIDWEKCKKRPEFAYNVILHDPGDVFAWTQLEIHEFPLEDNNNLRPKLKSGDTEELTDQGHQKSPTEDDKVAPNELEVKPEDQPTDAGNQNTDVTPESSLSSAQPSADVVNNEDKDNEEPAIVIGQDKKGVKAKDLTLDDRVKLHDSKSKSSDDTSENYHHLADLIDSLEGRNNYVPEIRKAEPLGNDKRGPKKGTALLELIEKEVDKLDSPKLVFENIDQKGIISGPNEPDSVDGRRFNFESSDQSSIGSNQDDTTLSALGLAEDDDNIGGKLVRNIKGSFHQVRSEPTIVCRPNSCNKHIFKMARFVPLINGAPHGFQQNMKKYFLNTKDKPLNLKLTEDNESFQDVDTCIRFMLYMDKGTELELVLQDYDRVAATTEQPLSSLNQFSDRQLELIKRTDSAAGKWELFVRCMSDYMPEYKPQGSNTEYLIKLALKPRGSFMPDKLIAVTLDEKKVAELRKLYPKLSFVPNIIGSSKQVAELKNYWILDRDGFKKPKIRLIKSEQDGKQSLEISQIDPNQEAFDITSRWIAIKDAELIDDPITFVYKLDQADWIQKIEFQFQRAGDPLDKWISLDAYKDKSKAENPNTKQDSIDSDKIGAKSEIDSSSRSSKVLNNIPGIVMKGLDSNEFRVRLRHHLKSPSNGNKNIDNQDKLLIVHSLAFADTCSSANKCKNGANCLPTGATTFDCQCQQGYSGKFCETVKPCEVLYGTQTGFQICESLGGQCVTNIPVMRCIWPNDQYYQCRITESALGNESISPGSQTNLSLGASGTLLKNQIDGRQKQMAEMIDSIRNEPAAGGTNYEKNQVNGNDDRSTIGDQSSTRPATSVDGKSKSSISEPLESLPAEEQLVRLKSMVGDQGKLVIILSVFIVAILIFSVVLIGSMVSRIRKSKRRLEKSQSDNLELARQSQLTSTSGNGIFATRNSLSGRINGAAVTAYSNSAFDVE